MRILLRHPDIGVAEQGAGLLLGHEQASGDGLGGTVPGYFDVGTLGKRLPEAGPLAFSSGSITNCSWQATQTS
jgi:hypothetical protein